MKKHILFEALPGQVIILFLLCSVTSLAQVNKNKLYFHEIPNLYTLPVTGELITDLKDSLWTVVFNDSTPVFVKSKDGINWYITDKTFPATFKLIRRNNGELYAYKKNAGMLLKSIDDGMSWTDLSSYLPVYTYGSLSSNRISCVQMNASYVEIYSSQFGSSAINQSPDGINWGNASFHGANSYGRDDYIRMGTDYIFFYNSACALEGRVFKCLYEAPLLMSSDTGKTWVSLAPLMRNDTAITQVKIFDTRIVAISQKQLHYSDDYGATWNTVSLDDCSPPTDIERNSQCYFVTMKTGSLLLDREFRNHRFPLGVEAQIVSDIYLNESQHLVAKTKAGYTTFTDGAWTPCAKTSFPLSKDYVSNNYAGTALETAGKLHPAFTLAPNCCSECLYANLGPDSVLMVKRICSSFYRNTDTFFISPDLGKNYYYAGYLQHPVAYWHTSHLYHTLNGYTYAIRSEKDSAFISADNGLTWIAKKFGTVPPYTKNSFVSAGDCIFWKHGPTVLYTFGDMDKWDTVGLQNCVFLFYNIHDRRYYFLKENSLYAARFESLREPELVYFNQDTTYHYEKIIARNKYMYILRSDNKIMYARIGSGFIEKEENEFVIYPNPFNSEINIWYGWLDTPDLTVSLFDLAGKLIAQERLTKPMEDKIVIGNTPPGIYLLRITGKDIKKAYKLLRLPN